MKIACFLLLVHLAREPSFLRFSCSSLQDRTMESSWTVKLSCAIIKRARSCLISGLTSGLPIRDRKSTRLNSSHLVISYAVFCLKKKKMIALRHSNEGISNKAFRTADELLFMTYVPSKILRFTPIVTHVLVTPPRCIVYRHTCVD